MTYVLDSSWIFKALKQNQVERIAGTQTLELARYKLGNVLWKEFTRRERVTDQELTKMAGIVKRVLSLMDELTVRCSEPEVLDLARELKLTSYDASYVHCAANTGSILVTEDEQLSKRAGHRVTIGRLEDISVVE